MNITVEVLYPAVRGLLFAALLLLVGTRPAGLLVRRHREALGATYDTIRSWLAPLPWLFGVAFLVFALTRGTLQVLTFLDPGDRVTPDLARAVLFSGSWGHAWTAQVLAALALVLVAWPLRRVEGRGGLIAVLLAILIWCQSGMGHPVESLWPGAIGRILDSVHVVGGGLWLGTLAVLAVAVFPSLRDQAQIRPLASIVADFSIFARWGAGLILLTGTIEGWRYTGSLGALTGSVWGRYLLIKIAVLGGVAVTGWWNWKVVTPALERGAVAAPARLRRAVLVEIGIGVLLLAVTTLLVAAPLPGEG